MADKIAIGTRFIVTEPAELKDGSFLIAKYVPYTAETPLSYRVTAKNQDLISELWAAGKAQPAPEQAATMGGVAGTATTG